MSAESEKIYFQGNFPPQSKLEEQIPKDKFIKFKVKGITDEKIIDIILYPLKLKIKAYKRSTSQLRIYFKKISSHPKMRSYYINLIKKLVQYEKDNLMKKRYKK